MYILMTIQCRNDGQLTNLITHIKIKYFFNIKHTFEGNFCITLGRFRTRVRRCANVTQTSSLLHLDASRVSIFRRESRLRTHISRSNVLPGNLKIIQHKVEFYGEYKPSGYFIFMRTLSWRCKIMIRLHAG